jgi:hypothetical protein
MRHGGPPPLDGASSSSGLTSTTGSVNGPLSGLNLSSTQTSEIASILSSAQTLATTPADVQSQINQVLTSAQQETLSAEFNNGFPQSSAIGDSGSNVQQQILAASALNANQLQSELNS